jgi:hypothetical protein
MVACSDDQLVICWGLDGTATAVPNPAGIASSLGGAPAHVAVAAGGAVVVESPEVGPPTVLPPSPPDEVSATTPAPAAQSATTTAEVTSTR